MSAAPTPGRDPAADREALRQATLEAARMRERAETLETALREASTSRASEREGWRARLERADERVRLERVRVEALEVRPVPVVVATRRDMRRAGGAARRARTLGGGGPPAVASRASFRFASRRARGACAFSPPDRVPPGGTRGLSRRRRRRRPSHPTVYRPQVALGERERTPPPPPSTSSREEDAEDEVETDEPSSSTSLAATRRGAGRVAARTSSSSASRVVRDLTSWKDPSASGKVFGGGLYALVCAHSLRTAAIPASAVLCACVMATLSSTLAWKLFSRLRAGVGLRGVEAWRESEDASAAKRRDREASARRVAAKLGGWVAATASSCAPAAAETWLFVEKIVTWAHPPSTLRACFVAWVSSLVARVWWLSAMTTATTFWILAFAAPPFLAAFGPAAAAASRAFAADAAARFAHVLNDRRFQLGFVGFVWTHAGVAGKTLLVLAAVTLVLTVSPGEPARDQGETAGGRRRSSAAAARGPGIIAGRDDATTTVSGSVVITELPASPTRKAATTATTRVAETRRRAAATATTTAPPRRMSFFGGYGRRAAAAVAASASSPKSERDAPGRGGDENVPPWGGDSPTTPTTKQRRAGAEDAFGGSVEKRLSLSRRRMIAERARRLMADSDDD